VQAFLLVRYDNKAAHLGDLKGGRLALPSTSRDHARLFLDKRRTEEMGDARFASTEKTSTVHDAIHQVIEGEADVTVTDQAAWNYFQKLYPGASQNLRILSRSDVFPPTTIAYKKGALTDETVKRFREGLMSAHQSSRVSKVMNLIKVDRFEDVPATFEESLKACLKSYPAPAGEK
jgi:ABC-type phosphate/phosphonate transport system substrate-binding protein